MVQDPSQVLDMDIKRKLSEAEKSLIRGMLSGKADGEDIVRKLDEYEVEELNDGGMGSLRVVHPDSTARHFGRTVAERWFADVDKVSLSIVVSKDIEGDFFELDIWKVNYAPLCKIPTMEDSLPQSEWPKAEF